MDPEAFECPICLSLFEGSIFQCKNGHVVCDACRVCIQGTCPSCREPVGDIRCRALEKAIAGRALPGSFRSHPCPFQGCAYSGLLLYDHIKDMHSCLDYEVNSLFGASWYEVSSLFGSSWQVRLDMHSCLDYEVNSLFGASWQVRLDRSRPFLVLLDRVERRVFLLLNGRIIGSGRSLSVVCLAPRPVTTKLEYKLEVCGAGALTLSTTGSVPSMLSWTGQYPTDEFLFVPDAYYCGSLDCVIVKVHVDHARALDRLASSVRRFHEILVKPMDLVLVLVSLFTAMVF